MGSCGDCDIIIKEYEDIFGTIKPINVYIEGSNEIIYILNPGQCLFYSSSVFLITSDNKLLILKNKLWTIPGGIVESGETSEKAMIRELKEETSIILNKSKIISKKNYVYTDDQNQNNQFYVIKYDVNSNNLKIQISKEHSEYAFVDFVNINIDSKYKMEEYIYKELNIIKMNNK